MTLITETKQLQKLCEELKSEEYITVDTEFLRDKFYYPKLCLVQIASEKTEFAVDPLADGMDLSPLFEIFANKKIVKIFHSARQDIEIILKLSGSVPKPLFDTQIAAMVCGFGHSASYAVLVSEITGHHVDKSSRFTDWSRRPLSEAQLSYAISDVTHLRDVYKELKKRLGDNKRESWLAEEMESLTNPENYIIEPEEVWKKLKPKGTSRRFLAIIKELAKWRELAAQRSNIPKTFIMKDQLLLEIAAVAPSTPKGLQSIRGAKGLKNAAEIEILKAIEYAKSLPDEQLPEKRKYTKPPQGGEAIMEMLKVLLKAKCAELHIAEKIVATADDLKKIACGEEDKTNIFHGWRNEVFGQYATALKDGKIALSVKNNKITIIDK